MKKLILLPFIIILFFGCAVSDLPRSTEVDKIINLKAGMDIETVNKIIGIKAYDILLIKNDTMIVSYNYKHYVNDVDNEIDLKEQKPFYVMYVNNKLSLLVTDKYDIYKQLLNINNNAIINCK